MECDEVALFSDSFEVLKEALYEKIFVKDSFFSKKYIVVENKRQKERLFGEFSKKRSVFGVNFLYQSDFLDFLYPGKAPSFWELFFLVHEKLKVLIREKHPAFSFLFIEKELPEKRLFNFSKEITGNFLSYLYLSKEKLERFLKDEGWQTLLFKESFLKRWALPDPSLFSFKKEDCIFHFFCNSSLKEYIHDFLALKKLRSVHYILSFCKFFWTDTLSDFARGKLLSKIGQGKKIPVDLEEFESFLTETNSLLANFGEEQRHYVKALEKREVLSFELYTEEKQKKNLIQAIKNDLLNLNPDKEMADKSFSCYFSKLAQEDGKEKVDETERSITISSNFSILREVETLFELINSSTLPPSSFLVLAADISIYTPYIHFVFGNSLPYRIFDIRSELKGAFAPVIDLISLNVEDTKSLYSLFSKEIFYKRHGFDSAEIETLFSSFERLGDISTEEKIARILNSVIFKDEGHFEGMKVSGLSSLERFLKLYEDLKVDSQQLSKEMTGKNWAKLLDKAWRLYFASDEDEDQSFNTMLRHLEKSEVFFSKEEILFILEEGKKRVRTSYNTSSLDGVTFATLTSGAVLPYDNICILGFDEDQPPLRSDSLDFFSQSHEKEKHLFLELFFSASALYFSYVGQKEGAERSPSLLLQRLMSYVKTAYGITLESKKETFYPFNFSNFEKERHCYDLRYYKASLAHLGVIKKEEKSFASSSLLEPPKFLKLSDLFSFSQNPVKHLLQKKHGLYFENLPEERNEFFLSYLQSYLFKKEAFLADEKKISALLGKYVFPPGIFGGAAKRKLVEELAVLKENLHSLEVSEKGIYDLYFRSHPLLDSRSLPLRVLAFGQEIELVGKLEFLSPSGLLFFDEEKRSSLFKHFPKILIFFSLNIDSEPNLLFLKDGTKKRGVPFTGREYLSRFVEYYLKSESDLLPLIKEWQDGFDEENARPKFSLALQEDPYLEVLSREISFSQLFEKAKEVEAGLFEPALRELKLL